MNQQDELKETKPLVESLKKVLELVEDELLGDWAAVTNTYQPLRLVVDTSVLNEVVDSLEELIKNLQQ